MGLGMTVRHLSGSKELVSIVNRMGHSSCYDEIATVDTSLALEVIRQMQYLGCVIPSNIERGEFIQAAADNLDFVEETIDGKNTTHATTIVLYQKGTINDQTRTQTGEHRPTAKKLKQRGLISSDYRHEIQDITLDRKPCFSPFKSQLTEELMHMFATETKSKSLDWMWCLLRLLPSKIFDTEVNVPKPGDQKTPGWSGFNSLVSPVQTLITKVGYCPIINASPTDHSTVYTVMNYVHKITTSMGQDSSVLTFDMAIYSIAKEIQWARPKEFENTVLRLGGFHVLLNYLASVGKLYCRIGLSDLFQESDLYGSNTTSNIMQGKGYKRAVRAHKLVLEAVMRLKWTSFVKYIEDNEQTQQLNQATIVNNVDSCRTQLASESTIGHGSLAALQTDVESIREQLNQFDESGENASLTFSIWNRYMDSIHLLLAFIRAERSGDWIGHLSITTKMIPLFVAMNRINYSRWLPIYVCDMLSLNEKHPDVHAEFLAGNHSVSKTTNAFSKVSTDMLLEQTINCDSKKRGGIVGITKRENALQRWFLSCHDRSAIVRATKETVCGMRNNIHDGHRECSSTRMEQDEGDVQKISTLFDTGLAINPFSPPISEDQQPLLNIVSGTEVQKPLANQLVAAYTTGREKMQSFVEERLSTSKVNFWAAVPRNKIDQVETKKSPHTATTRSDPNLLGRILVVAQTRQIDLQQILTYELSPYPKALTYDDGTLRKNVKSELLKQIETNVTCTTSLPALMNDTNRTVIIDGMALVHKISSRNTHTFGEFANKFVHILISEFNKSECNRVDVVFDRYDLPNSIKSGEHNRRGKSEAYRVQIHSSALKLPRQFDNYLKNPINKTDLIKYISARCVEVVPNMLQPGTKLVIGGGEDPEKCTIITSDSIYEDPSLSTKQEEADTRLLLHASNASASSGDIVIVSPDTDVAILSIYFLVI